MSHKLYVRVNAEHAAGTLKLLRFIRASVLPNAQEMGFRIHVVKLTDSMLTKDVLLTLKKKRVTGFPALSTQQKTYIGMPAIIQQYTSNLARFRAYQRQVEELGPKDPNKLAGRAVDETSTREYMVACALDPVNDDQDNDTLGDDIRAQVMRASQARGMQAPTGDGLGNALGDTLGDISGAVGQEMGRRKQTSAHPAEPINTGFTASTPFTFEEDGFPAQSAFNDYNSVGFAGAGPGYQDPGADITRMAGMDGSIDDDMVSRFWANNSM